MKARTFLNYPSLRLLTMLLAFTLLGSTVTSAQKDSAAPGASKANAPAYPLKGSSSGRYLVDLNNKPFLIVGDSPQGLLSRLTEEEADSYFADRQAHGFNTVGWMDALCAGHDFPDNTDAVTVDGIRPFSGYVSGGMDYTYYDLTKPNEAYFSRIDHIVTLAASHDILVFIDPMDTNGWLPTLHHNGLSAAYLFGQYLGTRYRSFPNVAWISGNDFVSWKNREDDALVQAVAKGIKTADPEHLQTVELNYETSSSFDDPTWVPVVSLNSTYSYSPTYMQMLHSYNQTPVAPTYLVEGHYDQENVGHPPDYGTPPTLRRQEYWTMLSGGAGQFYGNFYTWSFSSGWKYYLDTTGVMQLSIWKEFFSSLPWYNLIPDEDRSVVTAGLGTYGDFKTRVSHSDFCTAARTPDGSFAVAYMPTERAITVNMARLKAPAKAQWFDPSNGAYTTIPGGPFRKRGNAPIHASGKESRWRRRLGPVAECFGFRRDL